MTISSVVQGLIEVDGGKVFELDSPKGAAWVESVVSFRFEPVGDNKSYTVRKEAGKGGDYWYGYRKQNGKLHKKYIGKSSEINTVKLEEIAEALNTPPQPRVTEQNTLGITDIAKDGLYVTPRIVEDSDRLTALELQVRALQESLEALRSELPGKFAEGDSSELPNPSAGVTDSELQTELGNLRAENEDLKRLLAKKSPLVSGDLWQQIENQKERNRQLRLKMGEERRESIEKISELERLTENQMRRNQEKQARIDVLEIQAEEARANYATLLESSTHITNKLRQELAEVRSQLATERADREEIEVQLADLNQNSVRASKDLPEAADLLNQLKAKRKKSAATLADVETLLEMIEG